jgi:ribulose-5-phosphate 4-epimerase/fuculose-1-phosphate aldolase
MPNHQSSISTAKQQVVEYAQALVEKGFLSGTGGNLSVRIGGMDAFAVTPSNFDYTQMTSEDVCVLDFDGNQLEGERKPSIESGLHAAVYASRPDVGCVIHTHQVYASTLGLIDSPIPALYDEQVRWLGRSVEIVPYAPSGTSFLKKNIAKMVKNGHNAYIMKNHGALTLGPTPERAMHNVLLLEKCALTYLLALCTEKKITKIPLPIREIAFAKLRKDQKRFSANDNP